MHTRKRNLFLLLVVIFFVVGTILNVRLKGYDRNITKEINSFHIPLKNRELLGKQDNVVGVNNRELIGKQDNIVGVKPSICVVNPHLQKQCPIKTLKHDNTSHKDFETCRGYECMCFKQNPALVPYYPHNRLMDRSNMMSKELKLLSEPPVGDFRALPDPSKTLTAVFTQKPREGEVIKIRVKLYDSYGQPVTRGGDYLLGRIEGEGNKMDAKVTDFENGTYEFTFPTYWSGRSNVTVYLEHLREARRLHLLWKRTLVDIFYHVAVFEDKGQYQMTMCSVSPEITGYSRICNFTSNNNNHPWYCGHPPSPTLGCHHITSVNDLAYTNFPATEAELQMLKYRRFKLVAKLPVTIQEGKSTENRTIPACSELSPIDTWNRKWPLGYLKSNIWESVHCGLKINKSDIYNYLKNTTLHFFGDSTTRQFFVSLKSLTNCAMVTKDWATQKWHQNSICENRGRNFRMLWTPHEMPFSGVTMTNTSFNPISDAAALRDYSESISGGSKHRYIVVLHHYLHLRHPYRVYRHYMRHLKQVLEKLPNQRENLEVFIKGGHHFMDHDCTPGISDMVIEDFLDIMLQELKSCRHRVWFLDYKNMLGASHNNYRHAYEKVIFQMIRMMFGYIIKK